MRPDVSFADPGKSAQLSCLGDLSAGIEALNHGWEKQAGGHIFPSAGQEEVFGSQSGPAQELNLVYVLKLPQKERDADHCCTQNKGRLSGEQEVGQPSGLSPAQAVVQDDAWQEGQPYLQGNAQGLGDHCPAGSQTENIQSQDESGLRDEEPHLAQYRTKRGAAGQNKDQDQKGTGQGQVP